MEKSTGLCPERSARDGSAPPRRAEISSALVLDGRLALFHRGEGWLAVADLHFGYEASRRRAGGLWPLWGMESVADRLAALVDDYRPEVLVLVGDVVDSSAAPVESAAWLASVESSVPRLVLVEGNHDRGPVRRSFEWVSSFRQGDFLFEHGHLPPVPREGGIRVRGHLHPAVRFRDGAGLSLNLPCLVSRGPAADGSGEFILPAFSPWAGGAPVAGPVDGTRRWACFPTRVFEWAD